LVWVCAFAEDIITVNDNPNITFDLYA
jgi:hypothetical protein